jgi:hypothetical protein
MEKVIIEQQCQPADHAQIQLVAYFESSKPCLDQEIIDLACNIFKLKI